MRGETETKVGGTVGEREELSLKKKNYFNNVKKKIKIDIMILELKIILFLLFLNKI